MSDLAHADDQELLRQFTRDHSQAAFTTLVQRHVNLVYSAALRHVRSPQLAEDVTQSTFADLARNAAKLKSDTILTAWLYAVSRRTAVDVIRKESRRQLREQIAVEMNAMNTTAQSSAGVSPAWSDIEAHLDAAMAELDETDRAAVLLRYFENQSLRAVGQQLGVSDDAAQKRVSRAVERLREFFAKRGVSVGAGGLVVVISANAVQAAPVGLAVTISAAALAGTAATTSTLIAATTKTIAMTTLQKTLVTATVAVLAGAGIYEARQAAQLRDQVQMLQQQVDGIAQLQQERDDATSRLSDLFAENSRLKANQMELLKLRGDVGALRRQVQDAKQVQAKAIQTPTVSNIPADAAEQQKRMQIGKMIDGKNYAAQLFTFADKNQGWLPTNWLDVAAFSKNFPPSGTNDFEFVHKQPINLRELGTNISSTAIVREFMAWQTYDGKWRKVYAFADGHSQVVEVPDGNFTAWEEQNTFNPDAVSK